MTTDGRFSVFRRISRAERGKPRERMTNLWIVGPMAEDAAVERLFLRRAKLSEQRFATRREALAALNLALRVEAEHAITSDLAVARVGLRYQVVARTETGFAMIKQHGLLQHFFADQASAAEAGRLTSQLAEMLTR